MIDKPRVRDLAARLTAHFVAAGAVRIEPSVLQPASRLRAVMLEGEFVMGEVNN